jgi:hypothetical protein
MLSCDAIRKLNIIFFSEKQPVQPFSKRDVLEKEKNYHLQTEDSVLRSL